MARDADTHRELSRQFQEREVEKEYIAIVGGSIEREHGLIDIPIRKDMENPPKQCVDFEKGKFSQTRWSVLEKNNDCTRLLLRPITGRSHQLRIHLREIGHPIQGDDLYATPEIREMAPRLMLHAKALTITHPATNDRRTFTAEIPF